MPGRRKLKPHEAAGLASEAQLTPLLERVTACGALLAHAEADIAGKITRAKSADDYYANFSPVWAPRDQWPELRETACASAVELVASSKLARAADEIEVVRANLAEIVRELRRFTDSDEA